MPMPRLLRDLHITEVSNVDAPANKRKYLVIKSAKPIDKAVSVVPENGKFCVYDGDRKVGTYATRQEANAKAKDLKKRAIIDLLKADATAEPPDFNENYMMSRMSEISDEMFNMIYALRCTLCDILVSDSGDKPAAVDESLSQFSKTIASTIQGWLQGDVTKTKKGDRMKKESIAKIADEAIRKEVEEQQAELDAQTKTLEDEKAKTVALEEEKKILAAEVDKLKKDAGVDRDDTDEGILKSVTDPAVRKLLEKSRNESAAATKIAKEERDLRLNAEYVAKAQGFKALPQAKPEEFGPVLREIDEKLSEPAAKAIKTILGAADALIQKSVAFKVIGGSGSGNLAGINAEIDAAAAEIAKRDNLDLSKPADKIAAQRKVFDENQELYQRYRKAEYPTIGRRVNEGEE